MRAREQEVALDFIGKRGSVVGSTKDARVQYARELLQKELLPHIGMEQYCETKKVSGSATRAAAGGGRGGVVRGVRRRGGGLGVGGACVLAHGWLNLNEGPRSPPPPL